MTHDDQSNHSATSPTNSEAVRCGDWLGGWWVVWRWCAGRTGRAEHYIRVAAFATEHIARGWVAESSCRSKDLVLPSDQLPGGGQPPSAPTLARAGQDAAITDPMPQARCQQ